jgi:signal transduction histidine kinase
MITITLVTAFFCFAIGLAVFLANPYRSKNQAFALNSVVLSLWMFMVFQAIRAGALWENDKTTDPLLWLRANAVIASFFPATFWLLTDSIVSPESSKQRTLLRLLPWLGLIAALIVLCQSDSFASGRTLSGLVVRGASYYIFNFLIAGSITAALARGYFKIRRQRGIGSSEIQVLLLGFGATLILVPCLTTVGNLLNLRSFNRASVPVVLIFYAITAWAIAFHRVFDARQVFLGISQRVLVALILALGVFGLRWIGEPFLPPSAGLFLAVLVFTPMAFWLDGQTRRWLGISDEAVLRELREATLALSRVEPEPPRLAARFKSLLSDRFGSTTAAFIFDQTWTAGGADLALACDRPSYLDLCSTGWATPETLQRRRPSPGNRDLQQFMAQNTLGVMVTVPQGSPTPSLIVALGPKSSRWPFTYPEVLRLQRVAEWMNTCLIQSRIVSQAALEAKMEHLALMSRGLAHDLKNLITPISSFIIHTEGQFPATSAAGEVHSAAKRSVRIMTEYVRNSLFFSSRLTPRFEPLDLARSAQSVADSHAGLAAQRGVNLELEIDPNLALTADGALFQRLASNLVGNALDASRPGGTVRLRLSPAAAHWIRLEVSDDGCGIAPENLERIFEPYFTTKNFGDDARGFGLGLTVCKKITELHQGRITVQSEPGRGTRVAVELPATPSAFAPSFDATTPPDDQLRDSALLT